MASGPLYFRTPHIEEIPIANAKQAPGFAWVAVPNVVDPSKAQLEVAGKKRARAAGAPNEAQRDIVSNRRQREIEKRIKDLNNEGTKEVNIPGLKQGGANVKVGKTSSTKKILASGKEFKHYLDDEEAELARTGKIDGQEREDAPAQRASKMPLARRAQREDTEMVISAAPSIPWFTQNQAVEENHPDDDEFDAIPPFPSAEVVQALLDAPPLTYNAASQTPSYAPTAPARTFCEICGYFGRFRCLKCNARTCSVSCEDVHMKDRCLKFSS